jgi:hypothetical protein
VVLRLSVIEKEIITGTPPSTAAARTSMAAFQPEGGFDSAARQAGELVRAVSLAAIFFAS